jgi:hypothetical protein
MSQWRACLPDAYGTTVLSTSCAAACGNDTLDTLCGIDWSGRVDCLNNVNNKVVGVAAKTHADH